MGTKQLVVQLAFETTKCFLGSKVSSLTPITKVASAPALGALTTTRFAPASMWVAALARSVKNPVDSTTMSMARSRHGKLLGSRSASTKNSSPSTVMPLLDCLTSCARTPWTESYFRRWANAFTVVRSFTATMSIAAPDFLAARRKLRPIRPNPLMATRMAMARLTPRKWW